MAAFSPLWPLPCDEILGGLAHAAMSVWRNLRHAKAVPALGQKMTSQCSRCLVATALRGHSGHEQQSILRLVLAVSSRQRVFRHQDWQELGSRRAAGLWRKEMPAASPSSTWQLLVGISGSKGPNFAISFTSGQSAGQDHGPKSLHYILQLRKSCAIARDTWDEALQGIALFGCRVCLCFPPDSFCRCWSGYWSGCWLCAGQGAGQGAACVLKLR